MGCSSSRPSGAIIRQLFEKNSSTYTYVVACPSTKECCLIDPVLVTVERDLAFIEKAGYTLKYCLNTHVHADHITGSGRIKLANTNVKSVISEASKAKADLQVKDGDDIKIGSVTIHVRATPGHTAGCVTYVVAGGSAAFTGDALLINGCGRTDFQQGNPGQLYESVWGKIFSLPSGCTLYPGHDYNGFMSTTVGEEKKNNPRLILSKDEFIKLMNKKFDGSNYPKRLDEVFPRNMICGFPLPDNEMKA
eukprot:CAMPEP_0185269186 /NCGR_PEP_ID=MMETSP1359-20130426/39099_1 /TAXON_ID=552665 /ORGANISM="Bigelowiella longifila, Strain CCMP242" /LENGTH=248 /DNA_ID=CAMNT_0027860245 /DNA_START=6 /DNA_END=752 /DNA_ORIENTATION=-